MTIGLRLATLTVCIVVTSACVSDGAEPVEPDATATVSEISVTVPTVRLTPFCEAMIDLSNRLRSDEVADPGALIVETYRSIEADAPPEIAADFSAVLDALETGAPAPTDPPLPTTVTEPPNSTPATSVAPSTTADPSVESSTSVEPSVPVDASATAPDVDVGYADGTSPSERINNYVTLACRSTQNNPGPPPTQPLEDTPPTTAPEGP